MILNYLENKKISYSRVEELLDICTRHNVFTNNGPVKLMLEGKIAELIGLPLNKKVICVNNGTAALQSLIFYFEYIKQKKMLWGIPAFTFPSPVVNHNTCKIFDIDIDTLTIDCNANIDEVDGIIITNLFGTVVDIDYWVDKCRDKNKILIFDNSSSFISKYKGSNICSYGDASFGSLHHTKFLGFGEGGFIVIDAEIKDYISGITNFGFIGNHAYKPDSFNFKMSDVSACFILQHIESYDLKLHLEVQNKILNCLNSIDGFFVFKGHESDIVYGSMPVIFNEEIDLSGFRRLGIEANKYYMPLDIHCINAMNIYKRIINLPIYQSISEYQIEYMSRIIKMQIKEICETRSK